MNDRVRQVILRIMLLREEFTQNEIMSAVNLLKDRGDHFLYKYLLEASGGTTKKNKSISKAKRGQKKKRGQSQTLQKMRVEDPEKFELLDRFEKLARDGLILSTNDEIRRFCKIVGKEIKLGRTAKDSIGKIVKVLAEMEFQTIKEIVKKVPRKTGPGNSYVRLADYIISGNENESNTEK